MQKLIPIRTLTEEELIAFATERCAEHYPAGSIIAQSGDCSDAACYLLSGEVEIADNTGQNYRVKADTPKACFPLASGDRHMVAITATKNAQILKVSHRIMRSANFASRDAHECAITIPETLKESPLVTGFMDLFQQEKIDIPTLPDIALRLRSAMREDIGIADAVKIIQLDPVIAAKLIKVANCPLYLSKMPAKSCLEAINRIGLRATHTLVQLLTLKQIFKSSSPTLSQLLNKLWQRSIFISCIAYVLAEHTGKIPPDEALMAGLITDIGVIPLVNFAANLPKEYVDTHELTQAISALKGPVGVHILKCWAFSDDMINIPLNAQDWFHYSGPQLSLTDIVVLARLHSKIGTKTMAQLPAISSIPAAAKLVSIELSPDCSLQILHEAKERIHQATRDFSA
ncbi:MAG: HDOD domain-containing protein [Methylococcales bacterium]|nr:HDOD domain-containing protein [Methylococcales bacterium]